MTLQLIISICFVLGCILVANVAAIQQNPYCSYSFNGYTGLYDQGPMTKNFYTADEQKEPISICRMQLNIPVARNFFLINDYLLYIEIRTRVAPEKDKNEFFMPDRSFASFLRDGNEYVFRHNYLLIQRNSQRYYNQLRYLVLPRTSIIRSSWKLIFLHLSVGINFYNNSYYVFPYPFEFKYFYVAIHFENTALLLKQSGKRSISDYEAQLVSNQTKRSISDHHIQFLSNRTKRSLYASQIGDLEHVRSVFLKEADEPANYLFMMLILFLLTSGSVIVFLVIKIRESPTSNGHQSFNAEETSLNLELPLILVSKV